MLYGFVHKLKQSFFHERSSDFYAVLVYIVNSMYFLRIQYFPNLFAQKLHKFSGLFLAPEIVKMLQFLGSEITVMHTKNVQKISQNIYNHGNPSPSPVNHPIKGVLNNYVNFTKVSQFLF